jgi:hypothetical protein
MRVSIAPVSVGETSVGAVSVGAAPVAAVSVGAVSVGVASPGEAPLVAVVVADRAGLEVADWQAVVDVKMSRLTRPRTAARDLEVTEIRSAGCRGP